MPRPNQTDERRRELIPVVARAFAELGYRRTTTAELAERCEVQETILYRLWPDKKAMFIAAIDYVYEVSARTWAELLAGKKAAASTDALLKYEASHLGEFGHSRIIFAGLSETDDPEIRKALARMYQKYQTFACEQVQAHRGTKKSKSLTDAGLSAWALVGLGTVASIARELDLLSERERRRLVTEVGGLLFG